MNTQEIFNKAVLGVINQGCQSINSHKICKYRGPNKAKCAVGHLIDDEHYRKELEMIAICTRRDLLELNLPKRKKRLALIEAVEKSVGRQLEDNELEMLHRIQLAHDMKYVHFKEATREIATEFGLEFPDLTS